MKRPRAVTCLIGLVLTLTGLQAVRLWAVLSSWDYLTSLPLKVSPLYLGLSAAVWLIVGASLAWGLWGRKTWAPRATLVGAAAFAGGYWLDRLLLQAKGPQSSNLPFVLILSLVLLLSAVAILTFPRVRAYFGEIHD